MRTVPVAVVIPTHNRAEFVGRAVESVLRQTARPVEVVIVDDASTDGTAAILSEYGDQIRVIRSESNIERGAARNLGAHSTTAPILAFLDSDDEWDSRKLEQQVPRCELRTAVVTGMVVIDHAGRPRRVTALPDEAPGRTSLIPQNRMPGPGSSLAVSRDDFERAGGFPQQRDVQGSEDWVLLLRLWSTGVRFWGVREPLTFVRVHSSNSTAAASSIARSMWASRRLAEEEELCTPEEARRLRSHVAGVIARNFAREGDWAEVGRWLSRCGDERLRVSFFRAIGLSLVTGVHHALKRLLEPGREGIRSA